MASEWSWSPEAVGAIGSAVSAAIAIVASLVALHLGYVPSRLQRERELKRAIVASVVLWLEVSRLKSFAQWLASEKFVISAFAGANEQEWISSKLQCPLLKEYVDAAADLPRDVSTAVGNTYSLVRSLEIRMQAFSKAAWMESKEIEDEKRAITDLVTTVLKALEQLETRLEAYAPARNRSVSNTPSETSLLMLEK